MKALSIRQPWAWLIVHGYKDVENRTWDSTFRGTFYVHAGNQLYGSLTERNHIRDWVWERFGVYVPSDACLPRGGIVGRATMVDVVETSSSPWFQGPRGFVLVNAWAMSLQRCAGRLGFFEVQP